jgi:uncharacterized cupin superfamily protein
MKRDTSRPVPNIFQPSFDGDTDEFRRARLGDQAGCERLGISLYELASGQRGDFHYHLGNEELLIVVRGRPTLRTGSGRRELTEGDLVAFPRGERGVHGFENRTGEAVRVLVVSEMNEPNVSVYPDTNQVGVYDAARRGERRFGALFDVGSAADDYGGGQARIDPPR